jgi:hypothetical protein
MANEPERSPALDQVRALLFPDLTPEEGWARIDDALAGAHDEERLEAIEELAGQDLTGDLLEVLRRLRRDSEPEGGAHRRGPAGGPEAGQSEE